MLKGLGTRRRHADKKGVLLCPQPNCSGEGKIEDSSKHQTWYVRRTRGCENCGHVWTTAEIGADDLRYLLALEAGIRKMKTLR